MSVKELAEMDPQERAIFDILDTIMKAKNKEDWAIPKKLKDPEGEFSKKMRQFYQSPPKTSIQLSKYKDEIVTCLKLGIHPKFKWPIYPHYCIEEKQFRLQNQLNELPDHLGDRFRYGIKRPKTAI